MGDDRYQLHLGDCLDVLKGMAENSVDSVVTDPPYGLSDHGEAEVVACLQAWMAGEVYTTKGKGFIGESWDSWVPGPEVWRECFRVLKPGGYMIVFARARIEHAAAAPAETGWPPAAKPVAERLAVETEAVSAPAQSRLF